MNRPPRQPKASLWIAILTSLLITPTARSEDPQETLPRVPPHAPEDVAETFQTLPGFHMKLIAAEPLVVDPVTMVYDENGAAYVAEMRDYPYTDKTTDVPFQDRTTDEPIGRVRLLLDNDGDGQFDESFIFAEELSWPTGLACWKGGVFVAATPDIWYLKDTDGDHKADIRKQVFTGFRKYNVQAVMNNLTWGLDNHIYGAASGNGGTIEQPGKADKPPVPVSRQDFRFDAETLEFESISGGARFGNTFDDWGNRFICNIRNPVQHVVLPRRYLARNPFLPVPFALHDAAAAGDQLPVYRISPPEPWRTLRAQRWANSSERSYPRSETASTGFFTSSSGITIYRGSAYPPEFYGNAFLGEVAANIVHRQQLSPAGVTFEAERADEQREFVASTDNWFRPVNFVNAPDGSLHILDMYRETIEHPWSIPDDIKQHLDLESGRDRGRIYRLEYGDQPKSTPTPRLGEASTLELVQHLEHPDCWWRETAHRLLFERQDPAAVDPLLQLVQSSPSAQARVHALWLLNGLRALTEVELLTALDDEDEHVREHAVRLAEMRTKDSPSLAERIVALSADPSPRVQFQVAFTLGTIPGDASTNGLASIAAQNLDDPWIGSAVLSSAVNNTVAILKQLANDQRITNRKVAAPMLEQLAFIVAARNTDDEAQHVLENLIATNLPLATRQSILHGLADGLRTAGLDVNTIVADASPQVSTATTQLFSAAETTASQEELPVSEREQAITLLGMQEFSKASPALAALVDNRQPAEVQLAAVRALSRIRHPEVAPLLLEGWTGHSPAVRTEVLATLMTRSEWITAMLDAIEEGQLPVGQIPLPQRDKLVGHRDESIRHRSEKLFSQGTTASRAEVVESYRQALTHTGNLPQGLEVFRKNCATCHQRAGEGKAVGPAIETVRHRTPDELLVHILDPNREVSPDYVEYSVVLNDGRTLTGLIASETATSINLRRAEGVEETVLRANIEELASAGRSLMPEGLEKSITPQAMADLIELIRSDK